MSSIIQIIGAMELHMIVEKVLDLSPEARFLYWIRERHRIYLKRQSGAEPPWTDDEVLQSYFFTCPYRENDKTTVWFREKIRDRYQDKPCVLLATVVFRWFNYIPTGEILRRLGLLLNWNAESCIKALDNQKKIFTGAFMINSPAREPKLQAICRRIDNVWRDRESLVRDIRDSPTLEIAHNRLLQYEGLGGFMAYEIVCDLRYTYLLEDATDKLTWCNPGPGCIRGLYRIANQEIRNKSNATSPPKPKDWKERMQYLLRLVKKNLSSLPPFELREVEHSLCEFDKYSRALVGDGRLKRLYKGV